jgi:hypothetical protein
LHTDQKQFFLRLPRRILGKRIFNDFAHSQNRDSGHGRVQAAKARTKTHERVEKVGFGAHLFPVTIPLVPISAAALVDGCYHVDSEIYENSPLCIQ